MVCKCGATVKPGRVAGDNPFSRQRNPIYGWFRNMNALAIGNPFRKSGAPGLLLGGEWQRAQEWLGPIRQNCGSIEAGLSADNFVSREE